jgi:hypothetical protein
MNVIETENARLTDSSTTHNYTNSKMMRFKDRLVSQFRRLNYALSARLGHSPQALGVVYALMILVGIQVLNMLLNYDHFLLVAYNLIRLFMTIFCIVSLYTFVHLMYGKHLNLTDKNVYLLFFTCFFSEFLTQFLVLSQHRDITVARVASEADSQTDSPSDTNNISSSADNTSEPALNFLASVQHFLVIGLVFAAINYYSSSTFRKNVWLVLLIGTTRFYGSVAFSAILPQSLCVYFTYVCAISGVFFSIYLNNILSAAKNTTTTTTSTDNDRFYFTTSATGEDKLRGLANSKLKYIRSLFEIKSYAANSNSSNEETNNSIKYSDTITAFTAFSANLNTLFKMSNRSSNNCESLGSCSTVVYEPHASSFKFAKIKRNKLSKEALLSRRRTSLPTIPVTNRSEKVTFRPLLYLLLLKLVC